MLNSAQGPQPAHSPGDFSTDRRVLILIGMALIVGTCSVGAAWLLIRLIALAIRGTPAERGFSVGDLAAHLMIQHHSAVELINRLVSAQLVERAVAADDRRKMHLHLTLRAHELLEELSWAHVSELRRRGPELADMLNKWNHNKE